MKKAHVLAGIGATFALGWLAHRIGISDLAAQSSSLGRVLPIIFVAGLLRLFLQTRAWSAALRADGIEVPQRRLMAIRMAAQAAAYLTVLGPAASEPAKVALLRNPNGALAAVPATLVETGAYWFTTVILGLAGCCAAAFLIPGSIAVWLASGLFGAALMLLSTRRAILSSVAEAAGPRALKWIRSAAAAERDIRSFRDRHKRQFTVVFSLDLLAQAVSLLEVAAVLWAMGIRPSFYAALVIEAAGRMVKILAAWIPGRIGADEGGAAATFALLGLAPAAGLMLALSRRVRDFAWCAVGIVWAAHSNSSRRALNSGAKHDSLCLGEN